MTGTPLCGFLPLFCSVEEQVASNHMCPFVRAHAYTNTLTCLPECCRGIVYLCTFILTRNKLSPNSVKLHFLHYKFN